MLESMVSAWFLYQPAERVEYEVESDEFSRGHWSLDLKIKGVVSPEFLAFLIPALRANECHWFMSAINSYVVIHIQ